MKGLTKFFSLLICFTSVKVMALTGPQVFKQVNESILYLLVLKHQQFGINRANLRGYGTAVAITPTIVATNCHVLKPENPMVLYAQRKVYDFAVIASNVDQDLCLLKVRNASFKPVRLRASKSLIPGEDVYAVGNPKLFKNYISRGVFSKFIKNRRGGWILSDAKIASGSSGGGLFDTNGDLIGITTGHYKKANYFTISASVDWIASTMNIMPITQSESQIVNNIKTTDRKSKLQSNNQKTLSRLQFYDNEKLSLFKKGRFCFFYFLGGHAKQTPIASAIWSPKYSKRLFVFPASVSASDSLKTLRLDLLIAKTDKKKMVKSNSYIIFNKKRFPLYEYENHTRKKTVLYVKMQQPMTSLLAHLNGFDVLLAKNTSSISNHKVGYSLKSFANALADYHRYCGE